MSGVKGRRLGVVVYAPNGTAEGDVPRVAADGTLEWIDITDVIPPSGFVPTYIAPSETFTVPADRQALFAANIDNEGIIDAIGILIEVD